MDRRPRHLPTASGSRGHGMVLWTTAISTGVRPAYSLGLPYTGTRPPQRRHGRHTLLRRFFFAANLPDTTAATSLPSSVTASGISSSTLRNADVLVPGQGAAALYPKIGYRYTRGYSPYDTATSQSVCFEKHPEA